jgi:hypothetical protein
LESEGQERPFVQKKSEGEEEPAALDGVRLTEGVRKLVAPDDFAGLARLTGTSHAPDLMLAFADTSGTPLENAEVQQALLAVLDESGIREELGYGGDVIFDPQCFEEGLQIPPVLEIGLDARIEPCTDACTRVFFRTGDQG